MSDATPPTDPNVLLFPAFIYGINVTCQNATNVEAKRWRQRYLEHGDLPELELIPVPPGEVMLCFDSTPDPGMLGGGYTKKSRWHFYLIDFLQAESRPGPFWGADRNEIRRYHEF